MEIGGVRSRSDSLSDGSAEIRRVGAYCAVLMSPVDGRSSFLTTRAAARNRSAASRSHVGAACSRSVLARQELWCQTVNKRERAADLIWSAALLNLVKDRGHQQNFRLTKSTRGTRQKSEWASPFRSSFLIDLHDRDITIWLRFPGGRLLFFRRTRGSHRDPVQRFHRCRFHRD